MKYTVNLARWYLYEIEAGSIDEAIDKATNEYISDMSYPVYNTEYDSCIVEDENGEIVYEI
jgi:hypothetical protein